MTDNEQTPALPDQTHADLFDRLAEQPYRERDAATAAGYPPREVQMVAYEAGVEAATEVVREWLAGRTVLEPSQPSEEQWFVWAGGPDPDNAAMRCLRDDEADAREYWQWVHTASGSGIARRAIYFGPWEIVAAEASEPSGDCNRCVTDNDDGSDEYARAVDETDDCLCAERSGDGSDD